MITPKTELTIEEILANCLHDQESENNKCAVVLKDILNSRGYVVLVRQEEDLSYCCLSKRLSSVSRSFHHIKKTMHADLFSALQEATSRVNRKIRKLKDPYHPEGCWAYNSLAGQQLSYLMSLLPCQVPYAKNLMMSFDLINRLKEIDND